MTDLLSKEVVLKHLGMAMECEDCPRKDCKDIKLNAVEVCSIIRYLGTYADVQPVRRGKWEEIEDFDGDSHYGCTACGAEFYLEAGTPNDNEYYYCPHCGADMSTKG